MISLFFWIEIIKAASICDGPRWVPSIADEPLISVYRHETTELLPALTGIMGERVFSITSSHAANCRQSLLNTTELDIVTHREKGAAFLSMGSFLDIRAVEWRAFYISNEIQRLVIDY